MHIHIHIDYYRVKVIYFLLFNFYVCFEVNSVHSPGANTHQNSKCKVKKKNHGAWPFHFFSCLLATLFFFFFYCFNYLYFVEFN